MRTADPVPRVSQSLLGFFSRYSARYLKRHFHTVRLLQASIVPNDQKGPLIIFLNHASWWDPLVCLLLKKEFLPGRPAYAPMEAAALEKYRFLKRLGFFPVEAKSTRGATAFLLTATAILEQPDSVLFLTPQGSFADVRTPLAFQPGLEHLARRLPRATFVPLALEYSFWEERKPEILLAFGAPVAGKTNAPLLDHLAATQAMLSDAVQRRVPEEWRSLSKSRSGVNWSYDLWRGLRARLRGEPFDVDHGRL